MDFSSEYLFQSNDVLGAAVENMSRGGACPKCKHNAVEQCDSRGEAVCANCGFVLEESTVIEGLQFTETSAGGVAMVGQFVTGGGGTRGFSLPFVGRESREYSIQRGNNAIQRIAAHLQLSNYHIEAAQRLFFLAVQRSFTVGRASCVVSCACLYTICRRDSTPHLLIDFADVTQKSVRTLGQVFMKLLRVLHIAVPNVDPSLFIERFVHQMDLGNKTHQIAMTGVRLIQAMSREWLATGRRPTGLCGAALLVAARYHGFKVNAEDLVDILRISASTISKRLNEFRSTSAASLTADEFEVADVTKLPVLRGPPSLEARKRKKLSAFESAGSDLDCEDSICGESTTDESFVSLAPCQMRNLNLPISANPDDLCKDNPSPNEINALAGKMLNAIRNSADHIVQAEQIDFENSNAVSDILESLVCSDKGADATPLDSLLHSASPTLPAEPITAYAHPETESPRPFALHHPACPKNCIFDCSDEVAIEDAEVDMFILDQRGREAKAQIWDGMTKQVMPGVMRRLQERRSKSKTAKSAARKLPKIATAATSAAESVRIALGRTSTALLDRLNDSVLESIFETSKSRSDNFFETCKDGSDPISALFHIAQN